MASSDSSITDKAFARLGSLIKLLPTGTAFAYQFLNPLLIGDNQCHFINKVLSCILIVVCGLSCFFSTFTDSYKDNEGDTRYGIATFKGLWPSSPKTDLSRYKLRVGDFVHAFCSLLVFAMVALLNDYSVACFYPSFESTQKTLLNVLPSAVGAISSAVFAMFPTKRHYIGYPLSNGSSSTSLKSLSQG